METKCCIICGIELKKPIMLGEAVPKRWAKKHGYDGYQWRELKERVLATFSNINEELMESDPAKFFPDSVIFFTCMKHTGKEFDTAGEAAEVNED